MTAFLGDAARLSRQAVMIGDGVQVTAVVGVRWGRGLLAPLGLVDAPQFLRAVLPSRGFRHRSMRR